MNQFEVTFKRIEAFYMTMPIEAANPDEARKKADLMSSEGSIEFGYFQESDILEERIIEIKNL